MWEKKVTYSEKLKDPRWQRRRLEVFNRDNFTCVSCNRTDLSLHVHHIKYLPGLDPWEYDHSLMVTYCELCHNTEHLIGDQIDECLIEVIRLNRIYLKPVSQLCTLVEKWPEFHEMLKWFVNEAMISYLATQTKQPISRGITGSITQGNVKGITEKIR